MTRIVWLRPHSNNIPICNSRRTDIQSCPWQCSPACRSLEETELSAAQGCEFCPTAQSSLSGRMTADNETLFTVQGKGNFKGVAHMLLLGGMIAEKENWIERQRTRILFPGLPPKHYMAAVSSAVAPRSALPLGSSAVAQEGECQGRGASELNSFLVETTRGHGSSCICDMTSGMLHLPREPAPCLPLQFATSLNERRGKMYSGIRSSALGRMNPFILRGDLWPQVT